MNKQINSGVNKVQQISTWNFLPKVNKLYFYFYKLLLRYGTRLDILDKSRKVSGLMFWSACVCVFIMPRKTICCCSSIWEGSQRCLQTIWNKGFSSEKNCESSRQPDFPGVSVLAVQSRVRALMFRDIKKTQRATPCNLQASVRTVNVHLCLCLWQQNQNNLLNLRSLRLQWSPLHTKKFLR